MEQVIKVAESLKPTRALMEKRGREEMTRIQWIVTGGGKRAVKFIVVGGSITLLGIVALYVLVDVLSIQKNLAYLVLTIISLQLNFVLSARITWAERSGEGNIWYQWLKFHLSRGVVALLNQLVFALLVFFGLYYMYANLACIALATGLNFFSGELLVFPKKPGSS